MRLARIKLPGLLDSCVKVYTDQQLKSWAVEEQMSSAFYIAQLGVPPGCGGGIMLPLKHVAT